MTRTGIVLASLLRFCGRVDSSLEGFKDFCLKRCQVRKEGIPTYTHSHTLIRLASLTHGTIASPPSLPLTPSPQAPLEDVLRKIPPTLVQFFRYFDDVLHHRHFPNRFPLLLDKVSPPLPPSLRAVDDSSSPSTHTPTL